ncbi:endonuclease MutS2 [Eubacterium sp. MSJ-33]|uniref:endonuclease MutS2 n=1 Tax=Eubacterium sp. MSJ-33 TaxID=2841528 RepID=UPI0015A83076|nr:endonuclease MutS2 [Eubacterium sp. MSJ-33]QWT52423.1 endonuclease MutS2 [Eubacterium sp. MSJ-33]
MNKRSLRILEFNKILAMVNEYATSPMAKRRIDRMKPQRDIDVIRKLQEETNDALNRLNRHGNISFSGLRDIGASIKRLEVQGTLTSRELLDIAAVLQVAKAAKQYGDGSDLTEALASRNQEPVSQTTFDSLTERFNMLLPLEHISSEITRCILAENEFADDASSGLKNIRREIRLTNDKLHQQLDKIIKSDANRDQLQDSLITMRNGRYCIPVKQEYRSKFPGMIHDQSSTGSTLFIEPMAVVNLNNQIKELANEELLEIEKILESLSAQAAAYVSDIAYDLELLTDLDFIFAKAKFARATNSTRPIFNTDGIIDIRQGRHPLLEKHTVVPVDIRLGETYNLLIITGPNTGGKTVSLKTLGLFSLMGQAGLHIPAMEESRLAVFDDIFADIGDEQSIEQNLSTFSSHMSNIVYIVQHATPNTLCLFDEPGGGTDPVEGAALAVSILNFLKSMGARCMATTHYSELKTYALSSEGVENASCEFDVATLRPTYKLTIGIPGKSNAFAIASKLGLPDHIITSAKEQIDSDAIDMETLLADLEASKRSMEEDEKAIEAYKQEIKSLKESLQKKEENLDTKKAEILKKAREEAREIIEDAKDVADQTIRDYNKWRNNPHKADMHTMEEQRSKLRGKIKDYDKAGASQTQKQTSNHKASDFHIGDTVQVLSMGTRGTISKLPDSKGIAGVQMGILNSMLPISDLLIIPESTVSVNGTKQKYSGKRTGGDHTSVNKSMTFSPELNVMGKTVDEACFEIDKYLDDAVLAHISRVTIIHGKGTGALRKGIWQYLKKHPLVQSYRSGEFGEGEYGVTIVEL